MKAYRLILTAAASLAVAFGAQAQTNKEAIQQAEQNVQQKEQDLADARLRAENEKQDAQVEIDLLKAQAKEAQAHYDNGRKSLSIMKDALKCHQHP